MAKHIRKIRTKNIFSANPPFSWTWYARSTTRIWSNQSFHYSFLPPSPGSSARDTRSPQKDLHRLFCPHMSRRPRPHPPIPSYTAVKHASHPMKFPSRNHSFAALPRHRHFLFVLSRYLPSPPSRHHYFTISASRPRTPQLSCQLVSSL